MSFVILKVPHNGSRAVTIPYERAAAIKAVMDGTRKPQNDAQAAFIQNVRSIHLGIQHDDPETHRKAVEQASIWKARIKETD